MSKSTWDAGEKRRGDSSSEESSLEVKRRRRREEQETSSSSASAATESSTPYSGKWHQKSNSQPSRDRDNPYRRRAYPRVQRAFNQNIRDSLKEFHKIQNPTDEQSIDAIKKYLELKGAQRLTIEEIYNFSKLLHKKDSKNASPYFMRGFIFHNEDGKIINNRYLTHLQISLANALITIQEQQNLTRDQIEDIQQKINHIISSEDLYAKEDLYANFIAISDKDLSNIINNISKIKRIRLNSDSIGKLIYYINFTECGSQSLANIFNGLAKMGVKKDDLADLDYKELTKSINKNLTRCNNSQELANIFNGLAHIGVTKDNLEGLNYEELTKSINKNLTGCNSQNLANIFNGLAKMGVAKDNLKGLYYEELTKSINKNLGQCNSQDLAIIFNGLAKMGVKKDDLADLDYKELTKSINKNLTRCNNSQELANIFNGLAHIGVTKDNLKGLYYEELTKSIHKNLTGCNSQNLANIFNGLAKMGVAKDNLKGLNYEELTKSINKNLGQCNSQDLANIFNGLAKMGVTKDNLKGLNYKKLTDSINKNLGQCNSQHLANIFTGLLKCGFDIDFFDKIISNKETINKILKENKDNLTNNSAFALARFNVWCRYSAKEKNNSFLDESSLEIIKQKTKREQQPSSSLEKKVKNNINKEKFEIIEGEDKENKINEHILTRTDGIEVLNPDIIIKDKNGRMIFIEVDGPSHFNNNDEENGKTKTRNELYRLLGLPLVTIPFFEFGTLEETQQQEYISQRIESISNETTPSSAVENPTSLEGQNEVKSCGVTK